MARVRSALSQLRWRGVVGGSVLAALVVGHGVRADPPVRSVPVIRDPPTLLAADPHLVWPDRICFTGLDAGPTTVNVQLGCVCGDTPVCSGTVAAGVLSLEMRLALIVNGGCTDCTASPPAACSITGRLDAVTRVTVRGATALEVAHPHGCYVRPAMAYMFPN